MSEAFCSSILILDRGQPLGIWTERDALALDMTDPGILEAPIREVMNSPVQTVPADLSLGEAAARFRTAGLRHFLVAADDGSPAGVVTQTDVVRNHGVEWYLHLREVDSVLRGEPLEAAAHRPLAEVANAMHRRGKEAALIREADRGLGILTERDVLIALANRQAHCRAGDLASKPLVSVPRTTSLFRARNLMLERGIRHMAVTEEDGKLAGLIGFNDVLFSVEHMYVEELQETLRERDAALSASRHHLHLAEQIIETSLEGVLVTDAQGIIQSVNPAFTELTGFTEEEAVGQTPGLLSSGYHGEDFYRRMWAQLAREGAWKGEIWNRRKNGELYPELLTITAIHNEAGEVTHYAGIFSDISKLKENEERIRNQAYYDPLTELPNRRLFDDRLRMAIAHAHRHGTRLGVMFLDLDRFKQINDLFGHNAGDDLLREVASRLGGVVREDDTIARMGGDEFVLLAPEVTDADDMAHLAQRILTSFQEPLRIQGTEVRVTVSIGISLYPDDGTRPEALFRTADAAMYRSKDLGRNSFHFFTQAMNTHSFQQLTLESGLQRAIERDELWLAYQPLVEVATGELVGAEALLRWQHPEMGAVSPGQFIPLAEETGLILPLGEWVLDRVCAQLAEWGEQDPGFRISLNLSAHQIRQPDFCGRISDLIASRPVDPSRLVFELTESALMEDTERAVALLRRIQEMGIGVAADDFGTGYSSLRYLKRFPLSHLKVDKGFVHELTENEEDAVIVEAVIGLAHSLGLSVIAEGVETEAQRAFLADNGCDRIQGFLFGPPLPAEEFATRFLSGSPGVPERA
jgi:diguanylate cyclase (GGDEF)-like protein/PAS domain S-box-containing protein